MGIIHSRASKKRAKAEAKLLDEQRRQLKSERKRPATVGDLLSRSLAKRTEARHARDEDAEGTEQE